MSRAALIRAGGIAAIVGGVLRAAASFAPSVGSDSERQLLYLVVDMFLLLGLLGFYELFHQDVGRTGALGFLLALFGLLVVRSSRVIPGFDLYPVGALAFVGGLIALCGAAGRVKALAVWIPMAFVVSTLVGLVGTVADNSRWLFVLSGVLFVSLLPDSDAECGQQPADFDQELPPSCATLVSLVFVLSPFSEYRHRMK